MSTPFGKRGHFFNAWEKGGNIWERAMIPWGLCPRITPEFIQEQIEDPNVGEWMVKQEYCCEFVQTLDQVFTYDDVMAAMSDDIEPLFRGGHPI
jgi:hypothetical protein